MKYFTTILISFFWILSVPIKWATFLRASYIQPLTRRTRVVKYKLDQDVFLYTLEYKVKLLGAYRWIVANGQLYDFAFFTRPLKEIEAVNILIQKRKDFVENRNRLKKQKL